ncbi:predicted protein [Chaetomium globosum CBS 148.51]|uniref:Uncharacterized protein n=1 Tax=Chaetomium globosum (strain ATCC 6205 / CBS 148.51 / DSM 1962 / NBRC 6347 / NRRL 1970) TaxID=306901 RepID=Q2GUG3_CHAGB|nr:uncharacterized protein CHGG_08391 [Chaetomium globosum CBS 148.51]EAQ84377.1 predicted protein [Chaetomium globosum CBS 148.51]
MAVMSLRWLAAAAVCVPAVSAGMGREQVAAGGPIQTPAPEASRTPVVHLETASRAHGGALAARALLGPRSATPTTCRLRGWKIFTVSCLYNTEASAVGLACLTHGLPDLHGLPAVCLYRRHDSHRTLTARRTRVWYRPSFLPGDFWVWRPLDPSFPALTPTCRLALSFSYRRPQAAPAVGASPFPTCDTAAKTYTKCNFSYSDRGEEGSSARETSQRLNDAEVSSDRRRRPEVFLPSTETLPSPSTDDDDWQPIPRREDQRRDQTRLSRKLLGVAATTTFIPSTDSDVCRLALSPFPPRSASSASASSSSCAARTRTIRPPPPMTAAHAGPPGGPGFMGGPPGGPHGLAPPYGSPNPQQHTPPPDMAAMAPPGGAYDPRYSMANPSASPVHSMAPAPGPKMRPPTMKRLAQQPPRAPVYPPHHARHTAAPAPSIPRSSSSSPYNMGPTPGRPPQNGGYVPYPWAPSMDQKHAPVEFAHAEGGMGKSHGVVVKEGPLGRGVGGGVGDFGEGGSWVSG